MTQYPKIRYEITSQLGSRNKRSETKTFVSHNIRDIKRGAKAMERIV